ncbi:MAG: thioredoxin family protein [Chitinophagaceae bacterium]
MQFTKIYLNTLAVVLFVCLSLLAHSQNPDNTVQWHFSAGNKSGDIHQIILKASIQKGWRLFSTTMKDDEPNTRVYLDSTSVSLASIKEITETSLLQKKKEPLFDNAEIRYFENEAELVVSLSVGTGNADIRGTVNYMAMKGEEVVGPEEIPFRFAIDQSGKLVSRQAGLQESSVAAAGLKRKSVNLDQPVKACGGTGVEDGQSKGLLSIFILGFLGGLIALLTPCVFPMIPLTVSFFTKKSQSRNKGIFNAVIYGFFIFLIYILLSIPFHFLDSLNPEILNTISTNVWLNILFFIIFVVFALSFFGLFEITLPSSVANSVDAKSGAGGLAGIFFMALTLALVSFSCTGPILGSLLAGSLATNGGAMQLTAGMGGFGLALALPFALFALFPGWLNSLPRSGGWLTTVKIVLGFLELALAVKFLSNADLVTHWGILPREVFLAIWIVIGLCLVLYLFGIIRFKHEGPVKRTKGRLAFAFLFLVVVIYLLPGLTNTRYANRALISGFPPPLTYSVYGKDAFKGVEANVTNNYEEAMQLAKQQNKPLLIDFTGWACVNCRKMEENVWTDPQIKEIIEKNFILVSLYVDDRKLLPPDEQFIFTSSDSSRNTIKTIGDKFATFQSENFRNVSQPLYVVLSPDERLMTLPVGYTPNINEYAEWLNCGLEAFRQK